MKRILILALVGVVATLAFGFTATSSADGPTIDPVFKSNPREPLPKGYVCYDVQHGDNEMVDVELETLTYGTDDVQVRKLVMMCETSVWKKPFPIPSGPWFYIAPDPPGVSDTAIMACYELRHGDDAGMGAKLETKSFQTDKVDVQESNMMCESAKKHVTNRDGTVSTYGVTTNHIKQCFEIEGAVDQNIALVYANNNFGHEPVIVGKGVSMCEQGAKYRWIDGQLEVTGFPNGVAYECFEVKDWADDQNLQVTLETENFGFDDVTVREASQVCQYAEKNNFVIVSIPSRP